SSLCSCFHPPAPTQSYTPSLHDALPIFDDHRLRPCFRQLVREQPHKRRGLRTGRVGRGDLDHFRWKRLSDGNLGRGDEAHCRNEDRKSTRLNSSHEWISYAVFCLKNKRI